MRFKKNYNLYKITNLNTKMAYIGQVAGRTVSNRFFRHLSTARTGKGYFLHNAMREEGEENFICEHLVSAADRNSMNELEMILINTHHTLFPDGYNLTTGGSGESKKGTPIFFKGKWWLSIAHLAREYDLNVNKVTQRYRKFKWTLEQSLELESPPQKKGTSNKPVKFGETTYSSFRELCKEFREDEDKIRARIERGWTLEQAFSLEAPPKRKVHNQKSQFIDGNYFRSISEACLFYGIRKDKYQDRKKRGWSPKQIFGIHPPPPKKHPNYQPIEVGTFSFPSKEAATRYFGLHEHAVSARLNAGWTLEEAVGLKERDKDARKGKHPNSQVIIVNGKEYPSLSVAARDFRIKPQTLSKRLRAKWSIEESLGLKKRMGSLKGKHPSSKAVVVDGKEFLSLSMAAEEFGVSHQTLSRRLRENWTIEEAVGKIQRSKQKSF